MNERNHNSFNSLRLPSEESISLSLFSGSSSHPGISSGIRLSYLSQKKDIFWKQGWKSSHALLEAKGVFKSDTSWSWVILQRTFLGSPCCFDFSWGNMMKMARSLWSRWDGGDRNPLHHCCNVTDNITPSILFFLLGWLYEESQTACVASPRGQIWSASELRRKSEGFHLPKQ